MNANSQILETAIPANSNPAETQEKKQEPGLWDWVKANKKPILAVMGIAALAGVAYGLGNKKFAVGLPQLREEVVKQPTKRIVDAAPVVQIELEALEPMTSSRPYTKPTVPFDVTEHIRNLPEGQHHSAAKAALATAKNIPLEPNQTLVDSYSKYAA